MKPFFVYLLRCRDGTYYAGHTDDLELRLAQHRDGTFGGHTARRRPVELVWSAEVPERADALERELQLKRWSRAKKEALIRGDWELMKQLSRGPDRARPSTPRPAEPGATLRANGGVASTPTVRPERSLPAGEAKSKDAHGELGGSCLAPPTRSP